MSKLGIFVETLECTLLISRYFLDSSKQIELLKSIFNSPKVLIKFKAP